MTTALLYVSKLVTENGYDVTDCQTWADDATRRMRLSHTHPNCTFIDVDHHTIERVCVHDLKVNDRVFYEGALFQVIEAYDVPRDAQDLLHGYSDDRGVAVRLAKWIGGSTVPGYFGPGLTWNFQGNHRVTHWVIR